MITTFRRVVAAASLLALVSVIAAAPANAAVTGVGTSGGNVSVASLDYGDIIKASLLGENNSDTIDPLVAAAPTATETLSPLNVNSVTLPALNALSVAPIQTSTTGALDQKNTALVDLSTLGVPAVTGTVNPATLTSLVDTTGAQSALTSTLADLGLAGLLTIDSASINLGGLAGPSAATANRAVVADAVAVLDLQALLNLLGIDLSSLTLAQIASLLDALDEIDIVNDRLGVGTLFGDAQSLLDGVDLGIAAVDVAQQTLADALTALGIQQAALTACAGDQACIDTVQPLLTAAQVAADIAQVTVDHVLGLLDNLLQAMIDVLAGTPLLAVDGVTAGATAIAKDTEANSSAVVVGTINHIRVGGLDFGGVDANATLTQVADLATEITNTLNTVLKDNIDSDLANLLSVKLLQRATNVSTVGDYVTAVAGITALAVTVTPPDICATLNNLVLFKHLELPSDSDVELPVSPVRDALEDLGSLIPCVFLDDNSAGRVQAQAVAAFPALTGPLTLKAATVNSVAEYKVVAAPVVPVDEDEPLPRTGMNANLLLVIGGLMAAVALGLRRMSTPAKVRAHRTKQ